MSLKGYSWGATSKFVVGRQTLVAVPLVQLPRSLTAIKRLCALVGMRYDVLRRPPLGMNTVVFFVYFYPADDCGALICIPQAAAAATGTRRVLSQSASWGTHRVFSTIQCKHRGVPE